jgi:hypothetical protein
MTPLYRAWVQHFLDIFNEAEILEKSRIHGNTTAFTRMRKLSFLDVFYTILDVGRETTSLKLDRLSEVLYKGKKKGSTKKMKISQQAFSKARNKINEYPFVFMFNEQIKAEYNGELAAKPKREKDGWRLLAIDGTKIAMPNLPSFQESCFTTGAGATSPTALGSCLYDISNYRIIDAVLKNENQERICAIEHLNNYNNSFTDKEKTLFILDRGYPSSELISKFEELNFNYLMRCRVKFNCEIDAKDIGCDESIVLKGNKIRVVKWLLPSGQLETLITNDYEHTTDELKDLYFKRWAEECIYKTLKDRFHLENFSGKTENSVKQDFWATILAATMLMVMEEEVNIEVRDERKDKDNIYEYQVNRNIFVGIFKDDLIYAFAGDSTRIVQGRLKKVIQKATNYVCPIKPGRTTKRAKNKRHTRHHFNERDNT